MWADLKYLVAGFYGLMKMSVCVTLQLFYDIAVSFHPAVFMSPPDPPVCPHVHGFILAAAAT